MSGTKRFADLERAHDSFYVPAFEIDIGGETRFSPAKGQASSVQVRTSIEKANRLSFSVSGVYDQGEGDFTGLADAGLQTGNELAVRIGYGKPTETVMTGKISDVKPNFPSGGAPTVNVVGHDYRYFMDQGSGDKSWESTSVESVEREVASNYGFDRVEVGTGGPESDAPGTREELDQIVKDAESDLAFLRKLVTQHDYEMFSYGGVLRFRPTATLDGDPDPTVALEYGRGLRSYQRRSGPEQSEIQTVTHRGTNPRTGEDVSGSSDRKQSGGGDEKHLMKGPKESDDEAAKQAKAKANEIDHARRSTASTIGLPELRIGDWLAVSQLGSIADQQYDGTYYLRAVDHVINDSGYSTELEMSGPIPTERQ